MSRITSAPSASRPAKIAYVARALRKNWTQARLLDRELMALNADLGRNAGWGQRAH